MSEDVKALQGEWLYVPEAATRLSLTEAAVRQRIQRNQVVKRDGPNGKLQVLVPNEAVTTRQNESNALALLAQPDAAQSYWLRELRRRDVQIGRLQERVRSLSEQLYATQQALTALAQRQTPQEGYDELPEGEEEGE